MLTSRACIHSTLKKCRIPFTISRSPFTSKNQNGTQKIVEQTDFEDFPENQLVDCVRGATAEVLLSMPFLKPKSRTSTPDGNDGRSTQLLQLAKSCRKDFLECGVAHIPNFIRQEVVTRIVEDAKSLVKANEYFYSTESHNVYQEDHDETFPMNHPRNLLQSSSKYIVDYQRISKLSPLRVLYASSELRDFVSYIVQGTKANDNDEEQCQEQLFISGCAYNAAYYNVYKEGDGLGWHFDRSDFGVNLELQPAPSGGDFELHWKTRDLRNDPWKFDVVEMILNSSSPESCSDVYRIKNPSVGPGSLVIFAGSSNLHRVTPITEGERINAIMTYEQFQGQKTNAYSLRKFFGR